MTIRGETTAINVNVTPEAQVRPANTVPRHFRDLLALEDFERHARVSGCRI